MAAFFQVGIPIFTLISEPVYFKYHIYLIEFRCECYVLSHHLNLSRAS